MPETRWNSFPAFDLKKWRTAVEDSNPQSNDFWKRPIWSPVAAPFEFPPRCIAAPSEGNPWQLQESIHASNQVLVSLLNGVGGLRMGASDCDMTWFDGVHLNMVELHVEPNLFHANKLDASELLEAGWRGPINQSMRFGLQPGWCRDCRRRSVVAWMPCIRWW